MTPGIRQASFKQLFIWYFMASLIIVNTLILIYGSYVATIVDGNQCGPGRYGSYSWCTHADVSSYWAETFGVYGTIPVQLAELIPFIIAIYFANKGGRMIFYR